MTQYTVSLPYVDEHEQGEEFVAEILKLSNANEDCRPVFVAHELNEALDVLRKACEICRRYFRIIEFNVGIEVCGKDNAEGC